MFCCQSESIQTIFTQQTKHDALTLTQTQHTKNQVGSAFATCNVSLDSHASAWHNTNLNHELIESIPIAQLLSLDPHSATKMLNNIVHTHSHLFTRTHRQRTSLSLCILKTWHVGSVHTERQPNATRRQQQQPHSTTQYSITKTKMADQNER